MHGVMDRVERSVKKKWLVARHAAHETARLLSDALSQILAVLEDLFAVAPQVVKVGDAGLPPVKPVGEEVDTTLVKTVVVVKAVSIGDSIGSAAQMPLARKPGGVTGALQRCSQRYFGGRQRSPIFFHARSDRAAAGHQGCTGRSTHRGIRIPVPTNSATGRQAIDVGGLKIRRSQIAEVMYA